MHRALLLLVTLFLAACQTRLPETEPPHAQDWLTDSSLFSEAGWQPAQLSNWQYAAKVGINVDGKAEQANLTWRFHDQSNQIRLFGPLGSGAVKLEFDAVGVVLTDNKGRKYLGDSAQDLLSDVVGWPLPVNALKYWVFARPTPSAAYDYQLNDAGQLSALRQLGWRIDFSDWRDYQGHPLPRKVFATRVSPKSTKATKSRTEAKVKTSVDDIKKITVKLITKSWQWQ